MKHDISANVKHGACSGMQGGTPPTKQPALRTFFFFFWENFLPWAWCVLSTAHVFLVESSQHSQAGTIIPTLHARHRWLKCCAHAYTVSVGARIPILSSPPPPLGCTAAPTPPTPWAALHQTSDSKPSGMLSQSTAAALTPPLLNQPPRESKLGDSGEYYWLKYLVSHKAVSSVTWGRPTGKSYIHDCVCMHVSIVL